MKETKTLSQRLGMCGELFTGFRIQGGIQSPGQQAQVTMRLRSMDIKFQLSKMNKLLRFTAQHYLQSTTLTVLLKFYQQGRSHAKCFHYIKNFQMFN